MKESIIAYLNGPMDLQKLRDTTTPLALDAGDTRNQDDLRIANALLANFIDLDLSHISEQDFKQNLTNLLFSQYIEFDSLCLKMRTASSTSEQTGSFALVGTGRAAVFA